MLTWLDWYCRQLARAADAAARQLVGEDPRRLAFVVSLDEFGRADKRAGPHGYDPEGAINWWRCFIPFVGAFGRPEFDPPPEAIENPLGLVLTRSTAALLSDARPPVVAWEELAPTPRNPVYVELPHGALKIGADLELRAILARHANIRTRPDAVFEPMTIAAAVVTKQGSDRPVGIYYIKASAVPAGYVDILYTPDRSHPIGWRDTILDYETMRRVCAKTNDLLQVTLCYYYFGPQNIREEIASSPRAVVERRNGFPRKTESLFALTRLHPAPDRLGRPEAPGAENAGWSLTERQTVAGHFKLQAYGPKWSERRMIWIGSYQRGPLDAPERPKAVKI